MTGRLRRVATGGELALPAAALLIGIAIEAALSGAGLLLGSALTATFLLGPLVVGLIGGTRETATVAVLAVVLGLVFGTANGNFGSEAYWVRMSVLVIGGGLATFGAGTRIRNKATLRRMELLADVADVADGSLSLQQTVDRLLDLLVPEFADMAVLSAGSGPETLEPLGARIEAPDKAELERLLMLRRMVPDATVGASRAAATAESGLVTEMTEEVLRAASADEEDLALLRRLGIESAVFVPLHARGTLVGTLTCGIRDPRHRYDSADLRFAEVLAGRIALALDNAGLTATVSSLERRLEATLANLAEAVTVQDPSGQTIYANPAAVDLLRLKSAEELISSDPGAMMDLYTVTREDGSPVALADLPGSRAQSGEAVEPMLVRNVVRATGEERWLVNKATPVADSDGRLTMVVNVIEDVTEVKRAEFAQRLLAQAGELLSSSLDYEQTLQQVAHLAVPELADWCGVTLPDAEGVLRSVAVAHADPAKVALAHRLGEGYPSRLSDEGGAAEVIRTGQSQLVSNIPDELLAQAAADEEHLGLLRALHMRSVLIVPLSTGTQTLGVMALIEAESGRVFSEDDKTLAEELARRAAISVENARLYTERSNIAQTLQRSLLPPDLPDLPGWRTASLYRAAGAENEVGGDFYDVFRVPSGWMVLVGDVAGRGAEAAALTSMARYTLRAAGQLLDDPLATIGRLNAALRERPELSLVSLCCAVLRDDGGQAEAEIVCSGHPLPYLVRAAGGAEQVGAFGPFLGAFDDSTWHSVRVPLEPGDQLVLYTDGVIDTVGEHDRFGEERLGDLVDGVAEPEDAVARIDRALSEFESGAQRDDTAVLVVMRTGAPLAAVGRSDAEAHAR
jgi:PAS domain S-box-containing protein